jgi:predicted amino acid dehydrogenase
LASQESSPSTFLRILSEQGLLGYVFAGYMLHAEGIRVMPTLSAPETIRIQPSVFLPEEAMDRFVGAVERFLQAVQRCDTERLAFFLAGKDAAPPPRGEGAAQGRVEVLDVPVVRGAVPVCFLGHFLDADDVRSWDPGFGSFSQGECRTFVQKTKGLVNPFVAHTAALQSQQGTLVHLTVVGIPFSSEQVMDSFQGGNLGWARELIDEALVMAQDRGAKMVGFGGYTSIVTDNCRAVPADTFAVTSGNSLTSAAAVEAVKQAKARLGLRSLRLGVVGALGNIGAVLAELLAEEVDSVVLVGRPGAERRLAVREGELYAQALLRLADQGQDQGLGRRLATSTLGRAFLASHRGDVPVSGAEEAPLLTFLLEGMMNAALVDAIRKAIAQGGDGLGALVRSEMGYQAPITVATDMAALRSCNVILAATNAPRPVILPEHVGEGPVVLCDVAAPGDVHPDVARQRPEAIVLKGGMVRLPLRQTLRIPGMPLSDGEVYGCLGETILCGFAGLDEGLSVGKLTTEGVRRARDLALHHGFSFGEKFARTSSAEEPQGASSTAVKP